MHSILKKYFRNDSSFRDRFGFVIKGAAVSLFVKVISAGMAFIISVLVARYYGADGAGLFFLALTVVTIVAVISRFGFDFIVLKHVSAGYEEADWKKIHSVYAVIRKFVIVTSLFFTLILVLTAGPLSSVVFSKPELKNWVLVMAFSILPIALYTFNSFALQGIKSVIFSIISLTIAWQSIFLIVLIFVGNQVTVDFLSIYFLMSVVVAWFVSQLMWGKKSQTYTGQLDRLHIREYLPAAYPLLFATLLNQILPWSPLLLLGIFSAIQDVGVFNAALRTSMLINFIVFASQGVFASQIAGMVSKNNHDGIRKLSRQMFYVLLFVGAGIGLFIMLSANQIMQIFGAEFQAAENLLRILVFGQVLNLIGGVVPGLLMMSGKENIYRNVIFFTSMLNLGLNIIAIYKFGMVGAAWATTIAMGTQAIVGIIVVRNVLGFWIPVRVRTA